MNKSEIRKKILIIRKRNKSRSLKINFQLISKVLKKVKIKNNIIGGYYPYNYEVDVMKILEKFEKKNYLISLPKIKKNNQMDFKRWSTNDPLTINKYGIPEPTSKKTLYPNIIFVPLVAYDKNLNRIGYGGGFYDRYIEKIEKIKKVIKIGLAFSCQKIKNMPLGKYDKKLDFIITEKEILK